MIQAYFHHSALTVHLIDRIKTASTLPNSKGSLDWILEHLSMPVRVYMKQIDRLSPFWNLKAIVKGLNPGVISKVGWFWSSGWTQSWIGLLLLTVTVNNNSPIQDYVHPDDQTQPTFKGECINLEVRDGPLEKLWGGGKFLRRRNLFSLSNSLYFFLGRSMNIF